MLDHSWAPSPQSGENQRLPPSQLAQSCLVGCDAPHYPHTCGIKHDRAQGTPQALWAAEIVTVKASETKMWLKKLVPVTPILQTSHGKSLPLVSSNLSSQAPYPAHNGADTSWLCGGW